jgi:hypothetical protein
MNSAVAEKLLRAAARALVAGVGRANAAVLIASAAPQDHDHGGRERAGHLQNSRRKADRARRCSTLRVPGNSGVAVSES